MNIVTLRTGAQVAEPALMSTTTAIRILMTGAITELLAVHDLYELAQNPNFTVPPISNTVLTRVALLENGKLHDVTRYIVLAVLERNGMSVRMVNPA